MILPENNSDTGTLLDHIGELRSKIVLSFVVTLVGASIAHFYYLDILHFLLKPIEGSELVFLSILDPLLFIFKIDFFSGLVLASPLISWAIFSFIKPAMKKVTWHKLVGLYICSMILALGGLSYVYFIMLPISLKFLFSISIPGIENTITAQSYLNFVLVQSLITAVVFQIPLFILLGVQMNFFTVSSIAAKRGHIYLIGTIILSVLTPTTDILSLGIILLPVFIIFEGSILAGKIIYLFQKQQLDN